MLKRIKYMKCRGLLRDSSMDGTWIELSCKFRISPPGDETRHGWRWDAIIKTWVEVRHDVDGTIKNWMEVSQDVDGGETPIQRPGWGWDGAWVELRCNRIGLRGDLEGYEMLIMGPGWRWDVIWMEFRR